MKQSNSDYSFVQASDAVPSCPEQGLLRRVGCYNDKLFLAEHRMQKGWVGARHQHPHEQMVYVISGYLKVTVGSATFAARAGDSFVVCGGVEHQAEALEESVVIDVFTPCRTDYL